MLTFVQAAPGSPVEVRNDNLVPGHEVFNLVSLEVCAAGPWTGPWLGLCASTPAALQLLIDQVQSPVGAIPFHFVATLEYQSFGPFPVAPISLEGVVYDATAATVSRVVPFEIQ